MATTRQKEAARKNLDKARAAQSARAKGKDVPRKTQGLSTAEENGMPENWPSYATHAATKPRRKSPNN